ncbi:MAG: ATP phosphoribosyltransferase regulatory subunit, partial [Clostridia bacterium]|nr:ATP phosphoribosyltransferase regulatory subunit [Clostridia bacterium]
MLINKLHTPEGVKDYLPNECILKKNIEKNIAQVFESYGYLPVTSPTFEYNDVFCGMGGVKDSRVFKFLDHDGSLLVLRPDMTPAIARIAATAYNKNDLPLKFYYIDNMFRTNKNYQGKLREFTQAGIELLGVNSIEADAEVVTAAISSLLNSGVNDFKLDLGHALFLKGVIEEANVNEDVASAIQMNIIKKNYVAVNE